MAKPKETKAHEKAVEFVKMKAMTTSEDKPQFKLKRFQNVDSRISTNRKWANWGWGHKSLTNFDIWAHFSEINQLTIIEW